MLVHLFDNSVILVLFTILIGFLIWWSLAPFYFSSNLNLPGPRPWPLFGNFFELHGGDGQFPQNIVRLIQKYGEIFTCYQGRLQLVVIADPKLLKQILVKNFNDFQDRRHFMGSAKRLHEITRNGVINLEGSRWKKVRTVLTPTFSALKMKEMSPIINVASTKYLMVLDSHRIKEEPFDVWRLFGNYSLDVIASAAFGIDTESQTELTDQFVSHASAMFRNFKFKSVLFFLISTFPCVATPLTAIFKQRVKNRIKFFDDIIEQLLNARQGENIGRKDFIHLLLEAAAADIEDGNSKDNDSMNINEGQSQKKVDKTKLTRIEIKAQIVLFLLAGYDTTANTLAFCAYLLARHPDVQDRLIQEVEDMLQELNYNAVQEMPYMEMVLSETLRLYPPGYRFNRKCVHPCTIGGIQFTENTVVDIPVIGMHYNPKYWPDPTKFDPERFTPEAKAARDPYTFLPFSHGPRSCIGMRFAQLEMKIVLSRILQQFRFTTCPETEVPLKLDAGITLSPRNGIYLMVTDK